MTRSLDLPLDLLRSRSNSKWARYGAEALGAWVAEMDFEPAEPIQALMERTVSLRDYGYPFRGTAGPERIVEDAFVRRMQSRFDWSVDPKAVQVVTDLVQATIASVIAFTEPGDGVILHTPCYPPFRNAIREAGRVVVEWPLVNGPDGFAIDFDALERLDTKPKLFVLCNPHNPTGRAFRRDDLECIAAFAVKHGMVIFSDEIHADLVYEGMHIPIATLSADIAALTVTATSATKSFNIPGLRCGVMHFGGEALRNRFYQRLPPLLLGRASSVGFDATVAAWDHGQPWLDDVVAHLRQARDRVASRVRESMPGIRLHVPEATYLAWLDCSGLDLPVSAHEFFLKHAGVAFSAGETFASDCPHYLRFNFATSMPILDTILDRMEQAISQRAVLRSA